jgi:hypothetical protein
MDSLALGCAAIRVRMGGPTYQKPMTRGAIETVPKPDWPRVAAHSRTGEQRIFDFGFSILD